MEIKNFREPIEQTTGVRNSLLARRSGPQVGGKKLVVSEQFMRVSVALDATIA